MTIESYQYPATPTPRADAVVGTLWQRRGAVSADIAIGILGANADTLHLPWFFSAVASTIIAELARTKVIVPIIAEMKNNPPLPDERTIFECIHDAYAKKKTQ